MLLEATTLLNPYVKQFPHGNHVDFWDGNSTGRILKIDYNNVAYRPIAKRWLCKQQPLLCNRQINKHPFLCNGRGTVGP
jgi:hypothetical protein